MSGRFGNTSSRPYVEGRLVIPRLRVGGDLSFLVDTGADETFLMPGDALTVGLDYSQLQNLDNSSRGAGGPIDSYHEDAWIAFSDGKTLYGYAIRLSILAFREDMLTVPTLLGRDVLHRWGMRYRHSSGLLEFDIDSTDVLVDFGGPISPVVLHQ